MFEVSAMILFAFLLIGGVESGSYLNETECTLKNNTLCDDGEDGIWGPILEKFVLSDQHRHGRIVNFPSNQQIYISNIDRISNEESSESKISNQKIVNNNKPTKQPMKQVTETDLYLLNAIEKLVYRMDFMEKRLKKVEEMLYYVMAGNRMDQEPCPNNFTRVGHGCYFFSYLAGREVDWKIASKHCKKYNSILAEMETIEDNQDVITYIQTNNHLRGRDYWIGGLNPGLLWIWSNSARPVKVPGDQNKNTIPGNGRCLKLGFNPPLRSYSYIGSDCSFRYNFICKTEDESNNQIKRL